MAGAVLIEAPSSHLYPGARLSCADLSAAPAACLVAFADGARAGGRLAAREGGGWRLDVAPYRTARGRAIAARAWHLAPTPEGGLRVAARLAFG